MQNIIANYWRKTVQDMVSSSELSVLTSSILARSKDSFSRLPNLVKICLHNLIENHVIYFCKDAGI